mgnify:CR=1 FL=1
MFFLTSGFTLGISNGSPHPRSLSLFLFQEILDVLSQLAMEIFKYLSILQQQQKIKRIAIP